MIMQKLVIMITYCSLFIHCQYWVDETHSLPLRQMKVAYVSKHKSETVYDTGFERQNYNDVLLSKCLTRAVKVSLQAKCLSDHQAASKTSTSPFLTWKL